MNDKKKRDEQLIRPAMPHAGKARHWVKMTYSCKDGAVLFSCSRDSKIVVHQRETKSKSENDEWTLASRLPVFPCTPLTNKEC